MSEGIQGSLFEDRFLARYTGSIMSDPTTALVELVANAWDAYATDVNIQWPEELSETVFMITDNGHGMTSEEFEMRWRTIDYDRLARQGDYVSPPKDSEFVKPRKVYGQNGKGRHASFHFSDPYMVKTWKDGKETVYEVSRGTDNPINVQLVSTREGVEGHGCEISGIHPVNSGLSAEAARSILSTRFLIDPNFKVSVDGISVTFDDVPNECLQEIPLTIGEDNLPIKILIIDTQKADRTTKQHGIVWWVNGRLVGQSGWSASDNEKIVDGRSDEAKRYTFIVYANHLAPYVLADWSAFKDDEKLWLETQEAVQETVKKFIFGVTKEKRQKSRKKIRADHSEQVRQLSPAGRERWNKLLDEMVEQCPNLSDKEMGQVLSLLANMEMSDTQYSLLDKIHQFHPDEIDKWDNLLESWSISTAKTALDEIATRLKLIEEIRFKSNDRDADELHELQPLFERGLWIFGPEYEACDFTSNRTMATVIRTLFKSPQKASRNRPDFVITPDTSVGLYSRPSFDQNHNEDGVAAVVIVELKRAGVPIGSDEKNQAWKYISELMEKGHITERTAVHAFVLGNSIKPMETKPRKEGDNIVIQPMLYSTFTGQAEKRMHNLHRKLVDAPFMKETIERLDHPEEDEAQQPLDLKIKAACE